MFGSFFTVLSVASSVGQAFASYQQAAAMRAYYQAQADFAKVQYATQRAEAKEAGLEVLRETNRAIGSIVAKGAAGGILSNSGSVLLQQNISLARGVKDYNLTQLNAEVFNNLGTLQYRNLQQAGDVAMTQGLVSGIMGLGTDIAQTGEAGMFNFPEPTAPQYTPTPGYSEYLGKPRGAR